jgi:hypothetical protein
MVGDGTIYMCQGYGSILAENKYDIAACPTGKGGMCIVEYFSGNPFSENSSYGESMQAHLTGLCID